MEETSAFTLDVEGVFFYATEQDMDIEVDAWGTLFLPGGECDCLRVKRTFSALDTINVAAADIGFTLPREGTVYEWYAPGEGMPVLSVQTFIDIPAIWQYKPGETDAVTESAPVDWKLGPSPLQLGGPSTVRTHRPGSPGFRRDGARALPRQADRRRHDGHARHEGLDQRHGRDHRFG